MRRNLLENLLFQKFDPGGGVCYTLLISTILGQLNKGFTPSAVAVFLVGAAMGTNVWLVNSPSENRGILGGPTGTSVDFDAPLVPSASFYAPSSPVIQDGAINDRALPPESGAASFVATLQSYVQPIGIFSSRGGPITYTVRQGDTLSQIAADFGISVATITAANPQVRANTLRVGQEIAILPVSGILYEVKGGETLETIAEFFNVRPSQVREYNTSVDFIALQAGMTLVIPGAKPRGSYSGRSSLPDLRDYFVVPTQGFNWGRLHNYNAVDIANSCGTRVAAAAEGLVVDSAEEGWNNGYGGFVLIEHPNETKTRYAHLGEIVAKIGDYVKQNQLLGTMGNTGNVHGPTGCHLHFEVESAQNPFVKY